MLGYYDMPNHFLPHTPSLQHKIIFTTKYINIIFLQQIMQETFAGSTTLSGWRYSSPSPSAPPCWRTWSCGSSRQFASSITGCWTVQRRKTWYQIGIKLVSNRYQIGIRNGIKLILNVHLGMVSNWYEIGISSCEMPIKRSLFYTTSITWKS
jgi:hypothetical protein